MRSAMLIDATDLNFWAKRRDAQALLPKLIRRLVHGSVDRVIRASFRTGEGIVLAGWDGVVIVEEGNAHVPDGTSVWEMGTSADVKGKADEDYEKRTVAPGNVDPAQTTFIFVTPRRWTGKKDWETARLAEGKWLGVRAYDADDLEEWLERAPGVHIWLSKQLGKAPAGAVDLWTFWEDWASVTDPMISPELVLAGRAGVVKEIHKWLHNESSSSFAIKSESRDAALAVFAAATQQLTEEDQERYLSRAITVRDLDAFQQLATAENQLILLPLFESPDVVGRATRTGHRLVLSLGPADGESDNTLKVPRLSRSEAKQILVASGVADEEASKLAKLASRSLLSFRRRVALRPEVQQPMWARPEHARSVVAALLAGGWSSEMEGDREALGILAETSYDSVSSTLTRWANDTDAPVRNVANAWLLTAKDDAWSLIARYVTSEDLRRLEQLILDVLGTPHPRYELARDERYIAGVFGKMPRHSGFLQNELADTLAFIGARGEALTRSGGVNLVDWCRSVVRRLLDRANKDWRLWASLSHLLPLLAEAAPDEFMAALERGLTGGDQVVLRVFAEQEDALFGQMPHTGLVWSVETLAWNPEYLSRVASLCARLIQLVPEKNPASHLKDALRAMFLLWLPQTTATLERRLAVIDVLRVRTPEVAWWLLAELLPKDHDVGHYSETPRWRDWAPKPYPTGPRPDHDEGVKEIIARVLADVGENGNRWQQIIWALPQLGAETFENVLTTLSEMDISELDAKDRNDIWSGLRDFVSRHRSFPDANWALPKTYLERLAAMLPRFEPEDLTSKYSWLFNHSPSLPEGLEADWRAHEAAIETARDNAVRDLYDQGGMSILFDFATRVQRPGDVGVSLGKLELAKGEENRLLHTHLAAPTAEHAELARGFVFGRVKVTGIPWALTKLLEESKNWSPAQQAQFLICLPFGPEMWQLVESFGVETDRAYWRLINIYAVGEDNLEFGVRKLLTYDRPHAAVELLGLHVRRDRDVPATLITEALERMVQRTAEDDVPRRSLSHDVSRLLNAIAALGAVDESRIARLEWIFLPILGSFERRPEILHRELARSPEFFVELVGLCFRPEGEEPREIMDDDRSRARHAYSLLQSWRDIPGTNDNSEINDQVFKEWVEKARILLSEAHLLGVGDEMLGQVLSGSPANENRSWPHDAVCDVIEDCSSAELESGFEVGVYNSRGIVTKRPSDGGALEREVAERYQGYADAARERWPRTAAMLRRIAEQYRRKAYSEDQSQELREELE